MRSLEGAVLLGRRAAAFGVDILMFLVLFGVGSLVMPFVIGDVEEVSFVAGAVLYVAVVDLLPTARTGATLGQHLLRLRIRRADGTKLALGRAHGRALAFAAAIAVAAGIAALPAFVFARAGYPFVSDWTQVLEAIEAFETPVPTLGIAVLVAVSPLLIAGGRGWHELVSGTKVVGLRSTASVPPPARPGPGRQILLGAILAAGIVAAAVPAIAVAGRLSTLDQACRVPGERAAANVRGFSAEGPTGRSWLGVRRSPPPGVIADPWWVFRPNERTEITFADGSGGARIVAKAGSTPASSRLPEFEAETSFRSGGLRWLLYSLGSPAVAERHDALARCIQAWLSGT